MERRACAWLEARCPPLSSHAFAFRCLPQAQLEGLASELEASQLQLRTAQAAAAQAVTDASASAAAVAQAAVAAEAALEGAHRRQTAALQQQIDGLQQQLATRDQAAEKVDAEVRAAGLAGARCAACRAWPACWSSALCT